MFSATKLMISLVTTVLNDREGCVAFFSQMEAQTYLPDEIVIVDGGSKDGTWEFLQNYQPNKPYSLKVMQDIGCNVAQGRNFAIAQASFDIIASTDIGCEWEPEWLEEIVAPLKSDSSIDYVVGSWAVKPESVKTPWAKTEFVLRNGHLFQATPNSDATSRSIAYRKKTWQSVGGYPEDLTLAADDSVFMILLKKHGLKAASAPTVRCYWHRFERLREFLKEERRNFYGAGEALIYRKHIILVGGRLLVELVGLLGSFLILSNSPWRYLGGAAFLIGFLSIIHRIWRVLPQAHQLATLGTTFPLLRLLALDYLLKLGSIKGYIPGFFRGAKHCRICRDCIDQAAITLS
jgi:glycosyltransferase involved in cell wall biosynthesis